MAKIQEEVITLKFSKLIKSTEEMGADLLASADTIAALVQVAQELVGSDVIVELIE